jgi:hypothetical protein
MFYKNNNIVILMSPMQAQLCYNYNDHCFIDGTFYTAPKCAYQIITLRIHNILEDCFYTVGYGILTKKDTSSYIEFLDTIKNYIYDNRENRNNLEVWTPKTFHCDFELSIIIAIKQIFPNTEIKLCLWHMFRNIENKRKSIYGNINNQSQLSLNILKRIKTLCFLDPIYIKKVFDLISRNATDSDEKDNEFVNDYFKTTYIDKYNIKD